MNGKKSWVCLFILFNIFFFGMWYFEDIEEGIEAYRESKKVSFLAPKTFMFYELPGISTKTGDKGYTDTLYKRLSKDSAVIHLLGLMDEFSVIIGKANLDGFLSEEKANLLQIDIQYLNMQIAMIGDEDFGLEIDTALFKNIKHVKSIPYKKETSALCWEIEDVLKDLIYVEKSFVPLAVVRYFTALKYTLGHYKPEAGDRISISFLKDMTEKLKGVDREYLRQISVLLGKVGNNQAIADFELRQFERIYAEIAKGVSMPDSFITHGHNTQALLCDYYRVYVRKYERYNSRILKGNHKKFINRLSDLAFYLVLKNIQKGNEDIYSSYRVCA